MFPLLTHYCDELDLGSCLFIDPYLFIEGHKTQSKHQNWEDRQGL